MKIILFTTFMLFFAMSKAQTVLPLYSNTIPNSKPCNKKEKEEARGIVLDVTTPTLTVYLPEKKDAFKTAVIICPGGGYGALAMGHEGRDIATTLNQYGITAFLLKYRLPDAACMEDKSIAPLQDAQRALQLVREKAGEWDIDTSKIGVIGFSAGGHLAASLGTHFTHPEIENNQHTSLRPDFMLLIYPVISFTDNLTHQGSRDNLIGKPAAAAQVIKFSNELQVTAQTPPSFLVHAADDKAVNVENSLVFFRALKQFNIPAEVHIYQAGGHGFGMHNPTSKDLWMERAINWLQSNHLLKGTINP